MTTYIKGNTRSTSTTFYSKPDRMRPAARTGQQGVAKPPSWRSLSRRNRREPLELRIRWRGGAEGWWLVEARGTRQAFPSHTALIDMMNTINNEGR